MRGRVSCATAGTSKRPRTGRKARTWASALCSNPTTEQHSSTTTTQQRNRTAATAHQPRQPAQPPQFGSVRYLKILCKTTFARSSYCLAYLRDLSTYPWKARPAVDGQKSQKKMGASPGYIPSVQQHHTGRPTPHARVQFVLLQDTPLPPSQSVRSTPSTYTH